MYTHVNYISDNNRISSLVVICDGNGRNGLFPEFGRSKNQKTGDRGAQMHKCKNAQSRNTQLQNPQIHECTTHILTNFPPTNTQRLNTFVHAWLSVNFLHNSKPIKYQVQAYFYMMTNLARYLFLKPDYFYPILLKIQIEFRIPELFSSIFSGGLTICELFAPFKSITNLAAGLQQEDWNPSVGLISIGNILDLFICSVCPFYSNLIVVS